MKTKTTSSRTPYSGPAAIGKLRLPPLGGRLRELRLRLDLSLRAMGRQRQFGQRVIDYRHYQRIEQGKEMPGDAALKRLVGFFRARRAVQGRESERLAHELFALRYARDRSEYVRGLAARDYASLDLSQK